ncbi:Regulator of chromosome condensation (RCC1) repeat protein [compost metagenome]
MGTGTNWKQAAYSCQGGHAVRLDGTLWGWGRPNYGGLGISFQSPIRVGTGTTWSDISIGLSMHMIATKTDGTLWTWGDNLNGTAGQNDVYDSDAIPYQVGVAANWSKVSTGPNSSTAVKTNGTAYAWGVNTNGELGQGNVSMQLVPVQIGTATNWRSISVGPNHSGAIRGK